MANTDRVNGFKPYKYNSALIQPCYHAAGTTVTNDMFVGDMVELDGTGGPGGQAGVKVATAGSDEDIWGCVVAIAADSDYPARATFIDGASAGVVMVLTDREAIYEAQSDDVLAVTDVGQNAMIVKTAAGNRITGASGQEVDATVATTNTYALKVVGFPNRADNTINSADNKVLVQINLNQHIGDTGSTGV